jgi:CubicO group peptidase (beta-lactamase class C family)/uncharacterized Tic20 family protein
METRSIAKNLVYQRKLKGYSQEQLSEKTQVTVRTIQRIEKGDVAPHLQTIKLLATALNIEVDDLLVLDDPKEETLQLKWLLLMHGVPILGLVLPLCNILFPLFLWIHKREDNVIYDVHGRAVINFQITMTLLFILSLIALMTLEGIGYYFFMAVVPFALVVMIVNVISVMNTQKCHYPLSIPFLKTGKVSNSAKLLMVLIFCSISVGVRSQNTSRIIARLDGSVIGSDSLTRKIDQLMQLAHVQGMGVSIFNDDQVVYKNAFGFKDDEKKLILTDSTNMYGASLSKALFAVLVMKYVEQGIIDLDTPLETYLPKKIYEYEPKTKWHDDYSALRQDSLYHYITARMCLDHTTGFVNSRWMEPDYQLRVHGVPGSRYSYSGEGFIYLQVVLEKILGKGLEEMAQEVIFKPLSMRNSSYQWQSAYENDFAYGHTMDGDLWPKDTDNEPRGGSTLETTLGDYTRFLNAVLKYEIINKESWQEVFTPQIRIRSLRQFGEMALQDSKLNDAIALSYGLGFGVLESPLGRGVFKEGHGNGFQHYFILFPKLKKGMLIMTNSDNGESIFKELLEIALGDIYTPWQWENYVPYNLR